MALGVTEPPVDCLAAEMRGDISFSLLIMYNTLRGVLESQTFFVYIV